MMVQWGMGLHVKQVSTNGSQLCQIIKKKYSVRCQSKSHLITKSPQASSLSTLEGCDLGEIYFYKLFSVFQSHNKNTFIRVCTLLLNSLQAPISKHRNKLDFSQKHIH